MGKAALAGVDALTETTNGAYRYLKQHNYRKQRSSGESRTMSEKHVQTEMMSPTKTSRGQQTKLTGADDQWVKKLVSTCMSDGSTR